MDEILHFDPEQSDVSALPDLLNLLKTMEKDTEETLFDFARDGAAPFDPLTGGQSITKLPACVRINAWGNRFRGSGKTPQEVLEEQLGEIKALMHEVEELSEDEDDKRRRAEVEETKKDWEEVGTFLEAQKQKVP